MITVEKLYVSHEDGNKKASRPVVGINGDPVEKSFMMESDEGSVAHVYDEEAALRLFNESCDDLGSCLSAITLTIKFGETALINSISVTCKTTKDFEDGLFIANLNPSLTEWSRPWSYAQYYDTLKDELKKSSRDDVEVVDQELLHNTMSFAMAGICLKKFDRSVPLSVATSDFKEFINQIHESTERKLTATLNLGSLVTFFDFPPTVRVACEQYLQYFVQFLEDLGIEADSQISSNAGRVLFSVTPKSGEEALTAIQEALSVYLKLPEANNMGGHELITGDFAVHQLRANILHLQGQLAVAQALIQAGQATVEAKNATISAQAMQLAMFQSDQLLQVSATTPKQIELSTQPKQSNDESFFGGSVKLTTLKMKGFEVDLPSLYRALKRRLPGNKD